MTHDVGSAPGKHSAGTWPGGAPDTGMEMWSCVRWAMAIARTTNDSRRESTPPHPPPPPERRVRKWVLVHAVPMHQSTSGLMEQTRVYRNARNIKTKGRLPYVPGHRPWRKELRNVLQGEECRTPMFVIQMSQAGTNRALPNSAPLNRAAPQLSQLQMGIYHVNVQGRFDLHLTYGAKPRRIVPKHPFWLMTSTPMEALDCLRTSLHRPKHGLRPSSTQGCDIRWRNMARPPGYQLTHHEAHPCLESGNISRSSHRLDPGSIRVNGFLLSKARRPKCVVGRMVYDTRKSQ